jgi:hypothetical protein
VSNLGRTRGHLGRIRTPPGRILSLAWVNRIPRAEEQKSIDSLMVEVMQRTLLTPCTERFINLGQVGDTRAQDA